MSVGPMASTSLEGFLRGFLAEWPEWSKGNVRAEVLYYNPEQKTLEQVSHVNFASTLEAMRVRKVEPDSIEGEGICSYAARAQEAVLVPHVRFDRRYRSVVEPDHTQSELVVPLEIERQLVGLVNLESDLPRAFGNRHLERLVELAPILALLIEYETFRFEEEFMGRMAERLSCLGEESAIFAEVLLAALDLTGRGSSSGAVLLPDREDEPRWLRVSRTVGLDLQLDEERKVESFGIIRKALADPQGQRYWSLQEHGTEGYVPLAKEIQCEFVAVLRTGNRTLAVIDVESRRPALSERYRRAISRCSFYAASLVEGLRRRSEAERNRALNEGLNGIDYETHNAGNILSLLLDNLKQEAELSPRSQGYMIEIQERLKDGEALVRSFQEPQRSLDLVEILSEVKRRATILHLRLDLEIDHDLRVRGNRSGFIWLFENLISNSRRYAASGDAEVRAWLHAELVHGKGRIQYWDSGEDPTAIERFLSGRSLRRGWSHIQALCKLYRWNVQARPGKTGQLLFEFSFDHLNGGDEEVA